MTELAWLAVVVVLDALWLAADVIGLPGNWLILGTAGAVAWATWDKQMIGPWTLAALLVLAMLGEVAEFMAGAAGGAKAGASARGLWGAVLGGIVGGLAGTLIIPVPVFGSLAGACGGACVGAIVAELRGGRRLAEAVKVGQGAGWGRLLGTLAKLSIGVVMAVAAALAVVL